MTFLENVDFSVVFRAIGIGFLLFWLVVLGWVVFDASERFTSIWARIFSLLLVLLFPVFGLFIYLIIRPKLTAEEEEWSDLERRFLKFEADGLEDCNSCGFELMPNYVYCPNCGKELRRKCESCEVYLDSYWEVCPFCGTKQKGKVPDYDDFGYVGVTDVKKEKETPEPIAEAPVPAVSVESVSTMPVAGTSKEVTQTTRRGRKKFGGNTVKKYFEKTMLSMDGFVKYVGNIPLKAVNSSKRTKDTGTKTTSSKPTSSEVSSSEQPTSKSATSKSTKSKSTRSKSKSKKSTSSTKAEDKSKKSKD